MSIETILNAYDRAAFLEDSLSGRFEMRKNEKLRAIYYRRVRQRKAFRFRIIQMYRKRDEQARRSFDLWCTERGITQDKQRQIEELKKQLENRE